MNNDNSCDLFVIGAGSGGVRAARISAGLGAKVIVAEGECQLERQRRIKPLRKAALARGERMVRTRYGVDENTCTGDHSCIRLSGCPTLTLKASRVQAQHQGSRASSVPHRLDLGRLRRHGSASRADFVRC